MSVVGIQHNNEIVKEGVWKREQRKQAVSGMEYSMKNKLMSIFIAFGKKC